MGISIHPIASDASASVSVFLASFRFFLTLPPLPGGGEIHGRGCGHGAARYISTRKRRRIQTSSPRLRFSASVSRLPLLPSPFDLLSAPSLFWVCHGRGAAVISSRAGFPIALRRLGRKGPLEVPPKPARRGAIPSGWGFRSIPGHCHSSLRRVERYRE
jgi:hypothetical protein